MALRLYNTLGKKKQVFEPIEAGKVRMYNCGPTVYSYAHIGNFASFLMADVLRRYLEYSGYEVTQIMNITDVGHLTEDDQADAQGEDKLEKRAREAKKTPWEIAREFEDAFHADRRILHLLDAHEYPRATEHIEEMIELIGELLAAGMAYESGGQIYFSIEKYPQYGLLSGNTVDELMAGHRVETDPLKRNPFDFTLWKVDPKHLMQWDSPWGRGFPGWHIECSAMSRKYLGEVFDIHTGGEDNIFPHHECEIAQSSGNGERMFARYWLHRRHILVEKKKMSKSLGNFFTIRDLVEKGFSGAEIRYVLISAHYRSNLSFSFDGLNGAREALRYLREFRVNMRDLPDAVNGESAGARLDELAGLAEGRDRAFREALDDDLNMSEALAQVHGFVKEAYKLCRTRVEGKSAVERLEAWDRVLGVLDVAETEGSSSGGPSDEEIDRLVDERNQARASKDYARADALRDELAALGIVIKDGSEGTRWRREM